MTSKEVKVCPFDSSHFIDPSKFAKHLEKCKSPSRKDFEKCKWDPLHYIHFTKIEEHEKCR